MRQEEALPKTGKDTEMTIWEEEGVAPSVKPLPCGAGLLLLGWAPLFAILLLMPGGGA